MGGYNWNWPILLKEPYFGWIVSGFGKTILIAVFAWAIAFPLGSAIGIARTADNRALRLGGTIYVEIFRNIPLLVQMFLWYFVVPELLPADWGRWVKRDMPYPQFLTGIAKEKALTPDLEKLLKENADNKLFRYRNMLGNDLKNILSQVKNFGGAQVRDEIQRQVKKTEK